MKNKVLIGTLLVLFILTGFFREFVFLNVNEQMRVAYYQVTDSHVHAAMQWLSGFTYETLYYLKWPLTLLFAGIFCTYSAVIIQLAFKDRFLTRLTLWSYAGVFLLSFLFFLIGVLIGNREVTYDIARFLAGLVETPALLTILAASFLLFRSK